MKSLLLFLLTLCIGSSCHQPDSASGQATNPPDSLVWPGYSINSLKTDTTLFAQPEQVGKLADGDLSESSGIAASPQNPGYFWTQEDSGNPNEIQLINQEGDVVGAYTLAGLTNRDWEEITVGPGPIPGKRYVYVAEIGDNQLRYSTKIIYRFLEPTLDTTRLPVRETITAIDSIKLTLPDGPKNAEAILLDPGTLDLYLLSKEAYCVLYKASYPQSLTQTTMMEKLLVTPLDYLTAAAMSPDGKEMLIRTYDQLFYFTRQPGESVVDALKRPPLLLPLAQEAQGEAIGWAANGAGYYTTSERTFFFAEPLYFYLRN
ncbi:hypothetical protein [Fibrella arboris]|uniref:hypothetical protein n=1 Tax=Fibrella arboris TaxID=3242486 RepID=UPI00352189B1